MSNLKVPEHRQSRADFAFVYAAYALRYLYLLLLIPFYGRVLGVEGYGVVLAAMSLMAIAWRIVEWGFATVGMRSIATASSSQYPQLFADHLSARLLLSGLVLLGGGLAVWLSPVLAAHPVAGMAAVLLGIVSAFNLGWYFTGSGRPRIAVKLEVLGFAISLLLVLSLVRSAEDVDWALLSLLASGVLALATAHIWARREIAGARLAWRNGVALIGSSSAAFLYTGSSALLVSASTYLLSLLASNEEVGAFGAAERLVAVGLSVMAPAGQIFVPRITSLFTSAPEAAHALIRKALLLLLGIGVLGLLCSLLLGGWVVPLIFGAGFDKSIAILQCLSLLFPLSAVTLVLGSYVLIPLHQERLLARVVLLGATLSLLCAVPLSLAHGGMGMAIARVGGELFVFIGLLGICWKLGLLTPLFSLHHKQD